MNNTAWKELQSERLVAKVSVRSPGTGTSGGFLKGVKVTLGENQGMRGRRERKVG